LLCRSLTLARSRRSRRHSPASPTLPTVARSSFFCGRRWVAREGLEPSKPLGRQIYSLLRLTASLPRQESVFLESVCSTRTLLSVTVRVSWVWVWVRLRLGSQVWSWRRDSNPRPADYKSAALPA